MMRRFALYWFVMVGMLLTFGLIVLSAGFVAESVETAYGSGWATFATLSYTLFVGGTITAGLLAWSNS